ncbi:MAG: Stage III sporulation protein AC/AD protein family protein [Firmicutes bacterium ADurb.Bin182]|nr:MAG: Stage III sporulation protein AC/AD protein family protein [Firmicutes bacterium ADurb.Bin182]
MFVFKTIALAIIATVFCVLIKSYKPEMALQISIAAGILIILSAIEQITGISKAISKMAEEYGINITYITVILKAIGIAYLTQFAAQICKDAGETAIAGKVELIGRVLILAMALPLVTVLLKMIQSIVGTG